MGIEKFKDITAWFDGACKNVKGEITPMGVGVVIKLNNETIVEEAIAPDILGTSNIAEYIGLVTTLRRILDYVKTNRGEYSVLIHSDSQLVVNHYAGSWQCKEPHLRKYLTEAESLRKLIKNLITGNLTLKWVRREYNQEADKLSKIGHQNSMINFK